MVKFMQEENKGDKIRRVLQLYAKLSDGYVINKAEEAAYYGVTERSITIDSILDRLPTAHVLDEENGEYIVAAEVFGTGINMWIRSQGDYIEMIEEV